MTKLKQVVLLFLVSLISLSVIRIALFINYYTSFDDLNLFEIFYSFIEGEIVDIISISTFCFLPILLLLIPFSKNIYFRYLIGFIWFLILTFIIFIDIVDFVYFPFVNRHISGEILLLQNDINIMIPMMFNTYLLQTIVFIFYVLFLYAIWHKILKKEVIENSILKDSGILFLVFLLLILGVRGLKLSGKPFNISDAYAINKISSGNLAISGFYSFYRNFTKSIKNKNQFRKFFDDKVALDNVKEILGSKNINFIDENYPIKREFVNHKTKKYNVVIVLLESFSARLVDSFNGNIGLGVTPNLDYLANHGLKFINFFANGQRSIEGITAIFSGIVSPNSAKYLGSGLESSKLTYLGNIAKENGYHTLSMQSSKRDSFRVDSISKLAGFDEYYGAEDMTHGSNNEYKDRYPKFGTWDGDMFNLYFEKIDKIKKPFISFTFTSTTHLPFVSPGKVWEKYKPHNETGITGMLNTMSYTDDMIGRFIKKAKTKPWFKDTIFIFLADHTAGLHNISDIDSFAKKYHKSFPKRIMEHQRIPLIIYAPYIFKPKTIDTISSQADIIPTLIDFLGLNGGFSTISNSIFDNGVKKRFVIAKNGDSYIMITKNSITQSNLDKNIYQYGKEDLSKYILSIHQVLSRLLFKNKIY